MVSKEVQDTATASVACGGRWVEVKWADLPYDLRAMYPSTVFMWPDWMDDMGWDQAEAYDNGFAPWWDVVGCWMEGEEEFDSIRDHGRQALVLVQTDTRTAVLHPWQWSAAAGVWELENEAMTWITL